MAVKKPNKRRRYIIEGCVLSFLQIHEKKLFFVKLWEYTVIGNPFRKYSVLNLPMEKIPLQIEQDIEEFSVSVSGKVLSGQLGSILTEDVRCILEFRDNCGVPS